MRYKEPADYFERTPNGNPTRLKIKGNCIVVGGVYIDCETIYGRYQYVTPNGSGYFRQYVIPSVRPLSDPNVELQATILPHKHNKSSEIEGVIFGMYHGSRPMEFYIEQGYGTIKAVGVFHLREMETGWTGSFMEVTLSFVSEGKVYSEVITNI